jgi:hypothetical protein
MAPKIDTQAKKAEHKIQLREWMLHGTAIETDRDSPNFVAVKSADGLAYYRKEDLGQLSILEREDLIFQIAVASAELAEMQMLPKISMTNEQAKDCMFLVDGFLKVEGCDRVIDGEIRPIGFIDDGGYCFRRIPLVRCGITPDEKRITGPRNWDTLGPFMTSLRVNMADFDGQDSTMFRRLLSAIGALLWDSEPRREILYWYGSGGEGKTTLCNFLAHKLGPCALPNIKPKKLTEDYTIAMLEGKRMVIAEEVGKGRFLTEEMKAITGNRFLTGRSPYKSIRTFRNHTFFWMTSNQMPIIDGQDSSRDRLRLVCSTPRKDGIKRTEVEIFDELDMWWPHIVDAAVLEYFAAGQTILKMDEQELEECISNYHLDADGWILENMEYRAGCFVPNSTIKRMLKGDAIGVSDIKDRLHILQPSVCDADKAIDIKGRGRIREAANPVKGVRNVAIKTDSPKWGTALWSTTND